MAGPSVPSPSSTPSCSIRVTGAMPDEIFMFEVGLWITPTFRRARIAMSSGVAQTRWAPIVGPAKNPSFSRCCTGVVPKFFWLYSISKRDSETWMLIGTPSSRAWRA